MRGGVIILAFVRVHNNLVKGPGNNKSIFYPSSVRVGDKIPIKRFPAVLFKYLDFYVYYKTFN